MKPKQILMTFVFLLVAYLTFTIVTLLPSVWTVISLVPPVSGMRGDVHIDMSGTVSGVGTGEKSGDEISAADTDNKIRLADTNKDVNSADTNNDINNEDTIKESNPADKDIDSANTKTTVNPTFPNRRKAGDQLEANTTKQTDEVRHCSYEERRQNLRAACQRHKLRGFRANVSGEYSHLMVDDRHRVLYCYVPKAGCSSWKHLIALQSGKTTLADLQRDWNAVHEAGAHKLGLVKLSTNSIADIHRKLKTYTKFLVVRNPFGRLFSAYVDKFVWFYQRYAKVYYKNIINKTYPNAPVINGNPFITFEELLRIIVTAHTKPSKLLHLATIDEHWRTVNGMCHPCFIDYDYIAKIETMDDDLPPLLKLFNATELPSVHIMEEDEARRKNAFNYTKPSTRDAFASLPQPLVDNLKNIFQIDMDLFGYEQSKDSGLSCIYNKGNSTCC